MATWCPGAELSAPGPRSTSRTRTATGSSSSPADRAPDGPPDCQGQQGADDLLGSDRPAVRRGLQQAALGGAHDHRGHRARVHPGPEDTDADAFHQDVLQGEADLLALPGEGQPELLVVARPHPAVEEKPREVGIALAVGPEEDLHRAFQLHARRARASRHAGQLRHDGQAPLLDLTGHGDGGHRGGGRGGDRDRAAPTRAGANPAPGTGGAARLPLLHIRARQFPEDTNWNDSISTRKRRSEPGDAMRTSKGEEPRDATTPMT